MPVIDYHKFLLKLNDKSPYAVILKVVQPFAASKV